MEDRVKVYDVRKRVDNHETGKKCCYFWSCLYRRESCLYLGEIGYTPRAKFWPQVHVVSPWALERIWLCLYPNISHCWVDFFRMIFEKINKIGTQRPRRKAESCSLQIICQSPNHLAVSPPSRGTITGISEGQWWACPFHRWTRAWELVQPVQSQSLLPPHVWFCPADWLLLPDGKKSRPTQTPPCWVDGCGRTTRSPFFSSKPVMCSRQEPNLGCFGPKETFTTKLYTLENKWAFILEGNPARLFIICTTIIKLVLISIVECRWAGQLAGSGSLSGDHFSLKNAQWEAGEVLLLQHFSQDPSFWFWVVFFYYFILFCFFWHVHCNFKADPFFLSLLILMFETSWGLPEKDLM